ncbi:MAG: AAA family ATPase [Lachnospiraceae bacterium]|nr:AAA family ATPase [Lachnospiraceae bacterium]
MNKDLNLVLPEYVKTYINRNGVKENCKYLVAPPIYNEADIEADVMQGLSCYSSILKNANMINGKYFIIDCETEEKGLISVHYISSLIRCKREEVKNCCMDDYELGEIEFSEEQLYEKSFEPWYCDNNNFPIISYSEVINCIRPLPYAYSNATPYLLGGQNLQFTRKYWMENIKSPVIIVYHFENEYHNVFYSSVSESIGQIFDYFTESEMVFMLNVVEGNKEDRKEDDIEPEYGLSEADIAKIILEYEATRINVMNEKNTVDDINKLYLSQLLKSRGLRLAANISVKNIINKMMLVEPEYPLCMTAKLLDFIKRNNKDVKSISYKELKLLNVFKDTTNKSDKSLSDLVGMSSVKEQIESNINMMKFIRYCRKEGIKVPEYKFVYMFLGAPGTAKTTVAQIMGDMMKKEGLLEGTQFVSVSGAELKGCYVGHTAPKVHALFEENDIIIIDEAYSIASSGSYGMDTFSQEALAQLAIELENHGHNRLVIFAGYGGIEISQKNNKMKSFLDANPGIKSRINDTIYFPSYSSEMMVSIIDNMFAKLDLKYENKEIIFEMINAYFEQRTKDDNFGNGREARSFVENCHRRIANRVMNLTEAKRTKKELQTIRIEDIQNSINELKSINRIQIGEEKHIGFR